MQKSPTPSRGAGLDIPVQTTGPAFSGPEEARPDAPNHLIKLKRTVERKAPDGPGAEG